MDVGLIGLPRTGKSTVFNLLTRAGVQTAPFGGEKSSHTAWMPIPDHRLETLSLLYHPKKVTPALLNVVDVPGLSRRESGGPNRFLSDVRLVDALVHVVRGFSSTLDGPAHPLADLDEMELELALADLDLLEKRTQRIAQGKKLTAEQRQEIELVGRLKAALEEGQRLTQVDLTDDERALVRGYQFLTLKPMIWVINCDEETFSRQDYPDRDRIAELAEAKGIPVLPMAGKMEEEMEELSAEDRVVFMQDLGIRESGAARLAAAVYRRLGLCSFLTAGEDEVRAWTIREGTTAKAAAGKIHSDIERGFIRAEVVAFADLAEAGSMAKARELGKVRLEGRDYRMQDGDVVNFRFNV